jgi:heterodisulfide reductase subunit B
VGQILLGRKYKKNFEIPIVYYFQLLAIAQGYEPHDVGLHLHKVKLDKIMEKVAA